MHTHTHTNDVHIPYTHEKRNIICKNANMLAHTIYVLPNESYFRPSNLIFFIGRTEDLSKSIKHGRPVPCP